MKEMNDLFWVYMGEDCKQKPVVLSEPFITFILKGWYNSREAAKSLELIYLKSPIDIF